MKTLVLFLLVVLSGHANAYDETDLLKFLVINKCPDCDLSYADLSGSIIGIDGLLRRDLKHADLSGADLRGANLMGTDLSKAYLIGANLEGADLSLSILWQTRFMDANLKGVNLRLARTSPYSPERAEAAFQRANLSGANLQDFEAGFSIFDDADLSNVKNIEEAELRDAIFCRTKTPWGIENSGCD
jgi:uncharacterized protein YjbI with pentapeptide repeats